MFKNISLAMVMVLTVTCTSFAATYYVAAGSSGTGTSWLNAYGSLDSALAAAVSGDTVLVAHGTYVPSGVTFTVAAGVTLKGGYSGYWTSYGRVTNIGQIYNPGTYPVVLSGDTNGDDVVPNLYGNPSAMDALPSRADNKATILTVSGTGTTTIDGLVFMEGGISLATEAHGGAIICAGTTNINNCQFFGCIGSGGAIYSSETTTVTNCYFQGNTSDTGATIRATAGSLTVTKCTFKGNSNSGQNSNGIYARGSTSVTVNNLLVADSISGAVSAWGSLFIRSSNANSTNHVSNCVFRNDQSDACSTFLYSSASSGLTTFNFSNCLWAGCEGSTGNATILIRNGVAATDMTVNMTNITVADNKDPGATAGIKAYNGSALRNASLVINLKNSILWGNKGAQVLWDTTNLTFTDTTYNPFKISYCCIDTTDPNNYPAINPISGIPVGLVAANPQFVGGGDYHLQSTSPCIDKGDPASSYANEPKWLNGCRVNMGAYGNTKEAATTATCVALSADITGDCKVNTADLLQLRTQWLKTCP